MVVMLMSGCSMDYQAGNGVESRGVYLDSKVAGYEGYFFKLEITFVYVFVLVVLGLLLWLCFSRNKDIGKGEGENRESKGNKENKERV